MTSNFAKAAKRPAQDVAKWVKPPESFYKLNVDASYFPDGSGAVAAILRDHRGRALAGSSCALQNLLNAATAEAMAVQNGLIWLRA